MDMTHVLSASAQPTRVRGLRIIWNGGEHCVSELMNRLGASQSRMSRHMSVLKAAGLVVDRRDAQWVRYRRNASMPKPVARIIDVVIAAIDEQDGRILA